MGEVVQLAPIRDDQAHAAWIAFTDAKARADASRTLRDMATAVRAFESFMRLAGMTEAQRREILG